ncbi:D-2-hydroxyacid dehydrogenase [Rhodopila sp.]|jgi:phosphoglycerate dehydrogenase-like enzyme|uniref:D-2-hydroxyacid dehydrogenase n=1 Tax=Rhodopila sp. TaxID=2480087 RepID=UPI002BB9C7CF|nr:D-2-hydroxyacid dehydrogenase [Rhodopila sp.]HVZ09234.1 D-2-hydroxyacid dehydrogenase [Rhodopila sp.]
MTNRPHLLLWTNNPGPYLDAMQAAGLADRVAADTLPLREKPSEAQCRQTNVLMVPHVPPGLLRQMPNLQWAQAMTAGVESWLALPDLPPALTLTCARGTHAESMPENILAAIFYVAKPFAAIAADQPAHKWTHRVAEPLNDKTLGILGLGVIGKEVARLANALGMRVIGTRRSTGEPVPGVDLLPPDRTDDVLAQSDYLLLLLPATPQTENFMDARRLAKMKKTAWLLNFGRGHLIKDADLIAATAAGTIAGAVLDVFRQEPLPADHPFWSAKNIMVLPHIGGPHPRRDTIVARLFVDNLRRFLDGEPLKEVVDRARGY